MNSKFLQAVFVGVVLSAAMFVMFPRQVLALGGMLRTVDTCTVDCDTNGELLTCGDGHISYTAVNESSTAIYLAELVNDGAYATEGAKYCNTSSTCPAGAVFGGDIFGDYCYTASGTVTVKVRAGR